MMDGWGGVRGVLVGLKVGCKVGLWVIIMGGVVGMGMGKMSLGGLGCKRLKGGLVGGMLVVICLGVEMS